MLSRDVFVLHSLERETHIMFKGKLEWKLGEGRVFGLDISLEKMAVTALHSNRDIQQYEVPLNEAGLAAFLADLEPDDRVAMEATGNTRYLYDKMKPLVGEVKVADTRKLKLITHNHAKNDRNDSYLLALLLALDLLPAVWMPDPQAQGDRELLHRRHSLLQNQTRVKNRIHALLANHGLKAESSDLCTKGAQRYLMEVRGQLPEVTQESLASLLRELEFYSRELTVINAQVVLRAQRWKPQLDLLLTIPGVGLLVAFTILVIVGDIRRFPRAQSVGNYAGAVPTTRDSGDKQWSGGITKAGPSLLLWALIEAVQSLTRTNGYFRNLHRRIKRGRKKRHGIANVACARELSQVIWRMLTTGRPFEDCLPGGRAEKQPSDAKTSVREKRKLQREERKVQEAQQIHAEQPDTRSFIQQNLSLLMEFARKADCCVPIPEELRPYRGSCQEPRLTVEERQLKTGS